MCVERTPREARRLNLYLLMYKYVFVKVNSECRLTNHRVRATIRRSYFDP